MANFRNTADLLDGVLRRCGEITSDIGVSPRSAAALLYLNQIHHTIVSGGNELNADVDEPWVWARNRNPIVLDLLPSLTTGSVSVTQGVNTITFGSPPQVNGANASLNDWYIKPTGFPENYRIVSHTAGTTTAYIDAAYNQTSASNINFNAFKTDYDLVTDYIIIDSDSLVLDFIANTSGVNLHATVAMGSYTPAALCSAVTAALVAADPANVYSATYDNTQRLFTVSSNLTAAGAVFSPQGAGANYYRSAWDILGFDFTNLTGSASYTSVYPLSSLVRLTQPARIYYGYGIWGQRPEGGQIGMMDPVAFDRQYPMIDLTAGTPSYACLMQEKRNGTLKIRFNKYPNTTQNMRVEFDHIPWPKDLFNNSASIPIIPRKYFKLLEFGASYYICLDKEDSRADVYLGIARETYNAMLKENRRELQRTGMEFGAVIARADLMPTKRRLRLNLYGYDQGSY